MALSKKFCLAKRIHFESIDSTNTWAKKNPGEWAETGATLITASQQTGGRGRFNRRWVSPPNLNIYATFCFWLGLERTDIGHIPQLLALAASQVVGKLSFTSEIKWPNDLLIQGKKAGGILCETVSDELRRGIVCGIGLNVNMPSDILAEIDRPATSLLAEAGRPFDPQFVLEELQKEFVSSLDIFLKNGFAPFFPLFRERSCLKKGQKVRFHDNQKLIDAYFEDLNPNGSILLRMPGGELKAFYAGEFIGSDELHHLQK